jgi:hypothetical protein
MEEQSIKRVIYNEWNLIIRNMKILRLKYGRTTWVAQSNKGKVIVKITQHENKNSIKLNSTLGKMGICPQVRKSLSGKDYVEIPDGLLFISRFIPRTLHKNEYRLIKLISRFHRKAHFPQFVQSHEDMYTPLTVADWLEFYQQRRRMLESWSTDMRDEEYKGAFHTSIGIADKAIEELSNLDLAGYLDWSYRKGTLIHGDLHGNNVIFSEKQDYILDLDCTQWGPQAFDLHKLIPLLYRCNGQANIQSFFKKYFLHYPQAKKFAEIYRAVAMFPHCFYRLARRNPHDPALIDMARIESEKLAALK